MGMKSIRHRRPSAALIVAIVALIVALGGVAIASIPSADGTIHGCYNAQGQLRVIDAESGASCAPGETALSWNQTGPAGPPGPSQAIQGRHDAPVRLSPTDTTIAQLAGLTPGSYVLLAKLWLDNIILAEVPVHCTLHAGSASDTNVALLPQPTHLAPTQPMSFEAVQHFTGRGGAARISCHFGRVHGYVPSAVDVDAVNIKITAIRVDSVTSHGI
jgi:hypothetical protein